MHHFSTSINTNDTYGIDLLLFAMRHSEPVARDTLSVVIHRPITENIDGTKPFLVTHTSF